MDKNKEMVAYDLKEYWDIKQLILLYDSVNNITSAFEWIDNYKHDSGSFYEEEEETEELIEKCYTNIKELANVIIDNNIDYLNL